MLAVLRAMVNRPGISSRGCATANDASSAAYATPPSHTPATVISLQMARSILRPLVPAHIQGRVLRYLASAIATY